MTPTMERNSAETQPKCSTRPPLVLVEFEALEERVSKPVRRPIADTLYECGTLLWMASIVAAIAASMAHL